MPQARAVLILILITAVVAYAASPVRGVSDDDVGLAITRMQDWLLSQQNERGRWGKQVPSPDEFAAMQPSDRADINGETVMATYALLASGRHPQEEAIGRALRYLRENDPWGTYGISVRAHIWATLPDDPYLANLQQDARWLINAQGGGLWNYGPVRDTSKVDHSTTQYGVLGLWEFAKRGGRTPEKVWQDVLTHFLQYQSKEGGWAYRERGDESREVSGSMTAAGLTVLYVASHQLFRDRETPAAVRQAIARGHDWLDKHFTVVTNPIPGRDDGGSKLYTWYYLYGVERVALASGIKTIGGKDWFEAGAEQILAVEKGRGYVSGYHDDIIDTSFALLFLARGRVPVWISKISIPNATWNNRPAEVYNLTQYLSELREGELNWQVVSIDLDAEEWTSAPVAWLSCGGRIELTEKQRENLQRYLDMGGLLIVNPEDRAFVDSIRAVLRRMYPTLQFRPLASDHPAFNLISSTSPAGGRGILTLSNGVRDMVILLGQDWGKELQAARDPGTGDVWKVMTNLYAHATERGALDNRLVRLHEPRQKRTAKGEALVARARYLNAHWDVEQRAWASLENPFFNKTGYELTYGAVPLEAIDESSAVLVHLLGVDATPLSEKELQAIRRYVEKGGTLLVETIGGRGAFSIGVEEQLRAAFGSAAAPIPSYDPVLSGQGFTGGRAATPVLFRPYSILFMAAKREPRLSAFNLHGRNAVIISHDDLSFGVMGLKRWGINGYQRSTARDIVSNILLIAAQNRGERSQDPSGPSH